MKIKWGVPTLQVNYLLIPTTRTDDLNEFNAETKCYTGNSCLVYIDYILTDSEYVKSGYAILGIKPCGVHRYGTPYNPVCMREDYSVPLATKEGGANG